MKVAATTAAASLPVSFTSLSSFAVGISTERWKKMMKKEKKAMTELSPNKMVVSPRVSRLSPEMKPAAGPKRAAEMRPPSSLPIGSRLSALIRAPVKPMTASGSSSTFWAPFMVGSMTSAMDPRRSEEWRRPTGRTGLGVMVAAVTASVGERARPATKMAREATAATAGPASAKSKRSARFRGKVRIRVTPPKRPICSDGTSTGMPVLMPRRFACTKCAASWSSWSPSTPRAMVPAASGPGSPLASCWIRAPSGDESRNDESAYPRVVNEVTTMEPTAMSFSGLVCVCDTSFLSTARKTGRRSSPDCSCSSVSGVGSCSSSSVMPDSFSSVLSRLCTRSNVSSGDLRRLPRKTVPSVVCSTSVTK
mmetsp:Transcript_35258/g.77575  ORF Transcript_35258/g.77575 Transcript_35258/m.77575 type:complete len:365 (+) Transcript_35258:445-1539(+)